jgi:hypothetical protein
MSDAYPIQLISPTIAPRCRGATRSVTPISSALPMQAAVSVSGIPTRSSARNPYLAPYTIPYTIPANTGAT